MELKIALAKVRLCQVSQWSRSAAHPSANRPHGLPASRSRVSERPPLARRAIANVQLPTRILNREFTSHIMCGIFFSLSRAGHVTPDTNTRWLLQNRGPDSTGQHETIIESSTQGSSTRLHATFLSTVLALRGNDVVEQPLRDNATGSLLCWNGEAWSIAGHAIDGNDSQLIFTKLLNACTGTSEASMKSVIELLSVVRGPYALVFYDASNKRIYYGRDCLGRRSLLQKSTPDGTLVLSSVCDNASGDFWTEVEADGIYVLDVNLADPTSNSLPVTKIPHRRSDPKEDSGLSFVGRSSGAQLLLTDSDSAVSHYESHCRNRICSTEHQRNRSVESVIAKVTSTAHPAYTRSSA
jgi:hypothetical protein